VWPVSDRFATALAGPHEMTSRTELWRGDDTLLGELAISDGTVTLDAAAAVLGGCTLTAHASQVRGLVGAAGQIDVRDLNLYGLIVRPYRGIRHPGGQTEDVPLGRYFLTALTWTGGDTAVEITAAGYQQWVADARFRVYDAGGRLYRDILTDMISGGMPVPFPPVYNADELNALPAKTCRAGTVYADADKTRLDVIADAATALGVHVYPDRLGVWRFTPVTDDGTAPPGDPVWSVLAGPGGVQVAVTGGTKRDGVFNVVIATGEEGTDGQAPPSAEARVTDPGSPLRADGPFGRRVRFYASPLLTDTAMCEKAAATILSRYATANTSIDCQAVPNPALDPGDLIKVTRPDTGTSLYRPAAVEIPLGTEGTIQLAATERSDESEITVRSQW
jgi:hypothetical protein